MYIPSEGGSFIFRLRNECDFDIFNNFYSSSDENDCDDDLSNNLEKILSSQTDSFNNIFGNGVTYESQSRHYLKPNKSHKCIFGGEDWNDLVNEQESDDDYARDSDECSI